MMGFAQIAVGRVLNSLPEGLLIACGAWALLRMMGRRQNARTRFAIWLVALAGVAMLPLLGGMGRGAGGTLAHPEFVLSGFWAMIFLLLWVGAGAIALARLVVGIVQVRQLCRGCREVGAGELDEELREVVAAAKRPVRILASERVRVPAAVGFRRAAIVMPEWALRELSAAELKPVLIHELAHLSRRDDWTNLLQKAVRAALFFHPAVWWIDARLAAERELACDDAVLAATGNPRAYASCLIDMLERGCARRGLRMAQAVVARARDASHRIARILRDGAPRTTSVGRGALGLAVSLSLACAGVVVTAPRLVGFAPEHAGLTAQLNLPRVDEGFRPPAAAVVPAAFHPDPQRAALKKAAVVHRRSHDVRQVEAVNLVASREDKAPVVMARLNADRRETTNDRAARQEEAPTFLLFTPTERHAPAETAGSVRPAAAVRGGEGSPAVQMIQMVQVVEQVSEEDGRQVRKVQILRLVLIVPAQGGTAQSI
jgi:beta-lactamase regulating signal transducer with metallopeptidase domain